jgi:hypothetical protein
MAVARMFRVKYKISKFMTPHEGALMKYDGKVIGIEKSIINSRTTDGVFGDRDWLVTMEKNLSIVLDDNITYSDKQWYFDGTYAYAFNGDQDVSEAISSGEFLIPSGEFRAITVSAIHMCYLTFSVPLPETRICIAYTASNGEFAITSPIWKTLGSKMGGTTRKGVDEDNTGLSSNFAAVDEKMAVSLNFALAAGAELSEVFGYESIQPLQLPKLMVQLKTVNLPKLPKEIKATFNIGMTFTQTFAWLLGFAKQADTLAQEEAVRRLLKYLTSKGIYRKDSLKNDKIYQGGVVTKVPMLTLDQAKAQAETSEMKQLINDRWLNKLRSKFADHSEFIDSDVMASIL